MRSYNHILVPLSLDECNEKTLKKASELSNEHDTEISVVHILEAIPPLWVVYSDYEHTPDAIQRVSRGSWSVLQV